MSFFARTSSPVLTMSPGAAHQGAFGAPSFPHQTSPFSRIQSWTQNSVQTASSTPTKSRKRSRDEAGVNLDVEEAKMATVEPVKQSEDGWVYGPGMMLIKSPTSYVSEAGNQSGTWLEEKSAADEARRNDEARAHNQQTRPSLRSNKTQRLDFSSLPTTADEVLPRRSSPDAAASSPERACQPTVDNFTLHLGIGWSRISPEEHIQAAARGWARYIENHFPVSNVQIQLESKGLQSYLIEASEGFFLFAENLRQGQLVSRNLDQAFANLKMSPPVFEGLEVMTANESPKPADITTFSQAVAPTSIDVDMN